MAQRVALHTVRMVTEQGKRATATTPAVAPQYRDIKPGTLFEVPADQLAYLEEANAVAKVDDKRAARFGYGSIAAQAVEQEEGETDESAARRRKAATTRAPAETSGNGRRRGRPPASSKPKNDLVG